MGKREGVGRDSSARRCNRKLTVAHLAGLDSAQQMFPMVPVPAAAPISTRTPIYRAAFSRRADPSRRAAAPKPQPPKFEEIADDVKDEPKPDAKDEADAVKEQDPVDASDNKSESDSATVKPDVEPEPEVAVPTPQERAKAALLLTYLNMAACVYVRSLLRGRRLTPKSPQGHDQARQAQARARLLARRAQDGREQRQGQVPRGAGEDRHGPAQHGQGALGGTTEGALPEFRSNFHPQC